MLVVGGSPVRPSPALMSRLASTGPLVIACDSGADACEAAGVRIDVLIGDNDSISPTALRHARACHATQVDYPMDKDDVDLGLAVSWVRENVTHLGRLVVTGVSGGRLDHELAAMGTLARCADLGPVLEEDVFEARILSPSGTSTWNLTPQHAGRTLSVVAMLGSAVVSERGMRWDVDHAMLAPLGDLGVSNVVEREGASVTVHEGVTLVIVQRSPIAKHVTTLEEADPCDDIRGR